MLRLLLVICLTTTCACSTPRVLPDDLPPIASDLLEECSVPAALPDGRPNTQAEALQQDSKDLWKCHDRHKALADTVIFRDKIYNSHK